jgi:hypothetical protein
MNQIGVEESDYRDDTFIFYCMASDNVPKMEAAMCQLRRSSLLISVDQVAAKLF